MKITQNFLWVLEFLILHSLTVHVEGETCEGFTRPTPDPKCSRQGEREPTCILTYQDQDCGKGVAVISYENCPNQAVECCVPCLRQVIHDPSCTASYCTHGRLPVGSSYTVGSCEYVAGTWGGCHSEILMRTRQDRLLEATSMGPCKPVNAIEKVCDPDEIDPYVSSQPILNGPMPEITTPKPSPAIPESTQPFNSSILIMIKDKVTSITPRCSYTTLPNSTWSSCDEKTHKRTLLRQLDEDSSPECKKYKTETRPCFTKNGKERCFYTKWSRWSTCKNYIQQRQRNIIYGKKVDCNRTVKVRTCQLGSDGNRHRRHKSKKVRS